MSCSDHAARPTARRSPIQLFMTAINEHCTLRSVSKHWRQRLRSQPWGSFLPRCKWRRRPMGRADLGTAGHLACRRQAAGRGQGQRGAAAPGRPVHPRGPPRPWCAHHRWVASGQRQLPLPAYCRVRGWHDLVTTPEPVCLSLVAPLLLLRVIRGVAPSLRSVPMSAAPTPHYVIVDMCTALLPSHLPRPRKARTCSALTCPA